MKKVNIWQVGFESMRDYVLRNEEKLVCRPIGYVNMVRLDESWEESVWNLLNWSCWTRRKPKSVHSPLTHCNSDVILQVEGTDVFVCSCAVGWESARSLDGAFAKMKSGVHFFWPFYDVPHVGGNYKEENGEAYWRNNEVGWTKVTW